LKKQLQLLFNRPIAKNSKFLNQQADIFILVGSKCK